MAYNYDHIKPDLDEITPEFILSMFDHVYMAGINSVKPLGMSGDTFMIYGSPRVSSISLRNYCGDVELLICDSKGGFIFYGRFHIMVGPELVANMYYQIIQKSRPFLEGVLERPKSLSIPNPDAKISPLFDLFGLQPPKINPEKS